MTLRHVLAAAVAASFVLSSAGPVARAQPAPEPSDGSDKPWARGVSAEAQAEANRLFKEGNALVRDSFFVQAVERYREAVKHWDHPAIHYNLAIALINLDQPLELYRSLEKALAYGTLALDQEKIELAERYKTLVEQQLVWITVSCTEPDAKVFVDGEPALTCPGSEERLMRAGQHTFTATKPGHETTAITRIFPGGAREEIALRLYRPEDLTGYRRPLEPWIPWAVGGAGLALVGVGGLLHASAAGSVNEFDEWVKTCERETGMACPVTDDKQALRDGASTKQGVAAVAYAVGGAALAGGVVLLVINRPRPYRRQLEGVEGVAITPVVSGDGVGVHATLRW